MAADAVQAHYPDLEAIAASFGKAAETNMGLHSQLVRCMRALQDGGWQGQGSKAFLAEMEGAVLPALQRLTQALEQGQATTLKVKEVLRQGEEAAASLFKSEGAVTAVGASAAQGGGAQGGATPVNAFMGTHATSAAMGSGESSWLDWLAGKAPTDADVPPPPIPEAAPPPIPEMEPSATPSGAQGQGPGYDFTIGQEIGEGRYESRLPHWPGGVSGVTLGPGYDIGGRSKEAVIQDLTAVGVDEQKARALADGAGLTGKDAERWVKDWKAKNGSDLVLTRDQEKALFRTHLVPQYEEGARKHIKAKYGADWDSLSSDQKELLFDMHYNPGLSKFPTFTKAVLAEDWDAAIQASGRSSGGKPLGRNAPFKAKIEEIRSRSRSTPKK